MVAVTASPRPRDGVDFFPLSVDFEEKLYAVGRIPGSFMRREGRPSLPAVLASRLIDRPMRPLFPSDLRNDVVHHLHRHERGPRLLPRGHRHDRRLRLPSPSPTSPGTAPSAACEVGYVDGQIVINPTQEQRDKQPDGPSPSPPPTRRSS